MQPVTQCRQCSSDANDLIQLKHFQIQEIAERRGGERDRWREGGKKGEKEREGGGRERGRRMLLAAVF